MNFRFKTKLINVDADIAEQEQKIASFKADVARLYETFTKIEINTERLRLAKQYFDKGEFREADAILKIDIMEKDLETAKKRQKQGEKMIAEALKAREQIANEFLVKAQLWKTFYTEHDWFEKTCEYYEKALDASQTDEIVFQYALFLQNQNQYQFTQAYSLYEEALQIRRELAKENPRTYLPDVAMTLNNLAYLHSAKNEFAAALEKYEEALQIYRELAKENPRIYLPYVATTLNNLANLQKAKNEFAAALEKYKEALQIRRELAKEKPRTYLPDVAQTLTAFGDYLRDTNQKDKAIQYYSEAINIYEGFVTTSPSTYNPLIALLKTRIGILDFNAENSEHFLEEQMELIEQNKSFLEQTMPPELFEIIAMIQNDNTNEDELDNLFEAFLEKLPESKQNEMLKMLKLMGLLEDE